jgi:hypothetical protein
MCWCRAEPENIGQLFELTSRVVHQPIEPVDIWPSTKTADDPLRCGETRKRPVESPLLGNNWRPRVGNFQPMWPRVGEIGAHYLLMLK